MVAEVKTREEREAEWWKEWWDADYSWNGLADPAKNIGGDGGLHGERSLQDYWRRDPVTGEPREEATLAALGELEKRGDDYWHIAHIPLHWPDGTPAKADWGTAKQQKLAALIAARVKAATETTVTAKIFADEQVTGKDGRAQLQGCIMLAPPNHPDGRDAVVNISARSCWLPAWYAKNCRIGPGIDLRSANVSGDANFEGACFSGDANFEKVCFSGSARFYSAAFLSNVHFGEATFCGHTSFTSAIFSGATIFTGATFLCDVRLNSANLEGYASFESVRFAGDAGFWCTRFSGDTSFDGACFRGRALFERAAFAGHATFQHRVTFAGRACFDQAAFAGYTNFDSAGFAGNARFIGAKFIGYAGFGGTFFAGDASFDSASFAQDGSFDGSSFEGPASFESAVFQKEANFRNCQFEISRDGKPLRSGAMSFRQSAFEGPALFTKARFAADPAHHSAAFLGARFEDIANFRRCGCRWIAAFDEAEIEKRLLLDDPEEANANTTFNSTILPRAIDGRDNEATGETLLKELEGGCRTVKVAMARAKDAAMEQRYYRFELIARRHQAGTPRAERWLSAAYGMISDYGLSLWRPLLTLGLTILYFAGLFGIIHAATLGTNLSAGQSFDALAMSASRVFPFGAFDLFSNGWLRDILGLEPNELPKGGTALLVRFIATLESLIALILVFLFGLAVRRRFQIG